MQKQDMPKSQIDKFRDAARALETDESESAFDSAVAKVAKAQKLSDEEIKRLAHEQRARKR